MKYYLRIIKEDENNDRLKLLCYIEVINFLLNLSYKLELS